MIPRGALLHHAEYLYALARKYEEQGSGGFLRGCVLMHRLAADMCRAAGLRQYIGDAASDAPDQPWNLGA